MKDTSTLSQSQLGIYAECMQQPESDLYQLSYLFSFSKEIDLERLKSAILQTLSAHPYANCRVKLNEEGVAEQYIGQEQDFDIQIDTISDIETVKPTLFKKMALDGSPLL